MAAIASIREKSSYIANALPQCNIFCPYQFICWLREYRFARFASFFTLRDLNHCQPYFRGASIRDGLGGYSRFTLLYATMQLFPSSQSFTNERRSTGACNRSVSSWHGMPTASVKDKLFLK
jgi:hypothetical protein